MNAEEAGPICWRVGCGEPAETWAHVGGKPVRGCLACTALATRAGQLVEIHWSAPLSGPCPEPTLRVLSPAEREAELAKDAGAAASESARQGRRPPRPASPVAPPPEVAGEPTPSTEPSMPPSATCLWPGCNRASTSRGLCPRDYERLKLSHFAEWCAASTAEERTTVMEQAVAAYEVRQRASAARATPKTEGAVVPTSAGPAPREPAEPEPPVAVSTRIERWSRGSEHIERGLACRERARELREAARAAEAEAAEQEREAEDHTLAAHKLLADLLGAFDKLLSFSSSQGAA